MNKNNLEKAAKNIKLGKLVIFPTETVYGIGANALDPDAVKGIYEAKNRPAKNPVIVHISDKNELDVLVNAINEIENKFIEKFWPGPLTIIFEKSDQVPDIVSGGNETVAIRMPSNKIAQSLIKLSGVPIAAPSANISGEVSPTKYEDISEEIKSKVSIALDGGKCDHGLESTVVKVQNQKVIILRPGAISKEEIESKIDTEVEYNNNIDKKIHSPGTNYKHYSPKKELKLVTRNSLSDYVKNLDSKQVAIIGISEVIDNIPEVENKEKIYLDKDGESPEVNLFSALNELDRLDVEFGIIHDFDLEGSGVALMDRINRAAGLE